MPYPNRPLRKTSFSQAEAQGLDLNTANLDGELNSLVACADQLASRLESITTPTGLLKNVANALAMSLNGVQVFTATANQTTFTTTIPWDAAFTNLSVSVVSQGLKLNPSLVTVSNSGGVLRVVTPAQTLNNVVQVLAYSAGAGVLTRLSSLSAGDGATLVGVRDIGNYWTSAQVESVLQEVGLRVQTLEAGDPTRWKKDGSNGPATGDWDLGTHQIKGLAPGTAGTDAVNLTQLSTITNEVSSLLRGACTVFGFTMQGGIDMSGNAIENLPTPALDGDAANKQYVDDTVAGAVHVLTGFLKRDGTNAMTANLNVGTHKVVGVVAGTSNTDAVNVDQLEAVETGALKRDGTNSPSANIDWNAKRITNLADGVNEQDAATVSQLPSLTNYLKRDGTNSPSADISWNTKKLTDLADGASPQDAVNKGQLDDVEDLTTRVYGLLRKQAYSGDEVSVTAGMIHFVVTLTPGRYAAIGSSGLKANAAMNRMLIRAGTGIRSGGSSIVYSLKVTRSRDGVNSAVFSSDDYFSGSDDDDFFAGPHITHIVSNVQVDDIFFIEYEAPGELQTADAYIHCEKLS
jgi:hypothetical protein